MGNVIGDLIGNVNWDLIWNVIGDLISGKDFDFNLDVIGKDCDFNLDVNGNVNGHVIGIDFGRNPGCAPPLGFGESPISRTHPRLGKNPNFSTLELGVSRVFPPPHSLTREDRNFLRLTGGLSEPQIPPRRWHRSRV